MRSPYRDVPFCQIQRGDTSQNSVSAIWSPGGGAPGACSEQEKDAPGVTGSGGRIKGVGSALPDRVTMDVGDRQLLSVRKAGTQRTAWQGRSCQLPGPGRTAGSIASPPEPQKEKPRLGSVGKFLNSFLDAISGLSTTQAEVSLKPGREELKLEIGRQGLAQVSEHRLADPERLWVDETLLA